MEQKKKNEQIKKSEDEKTQFTNFQNIWKSMQSEFKKLTTLDEQHEFLDLLYSNIEKLQLNDYKYPNLGGCDFSILTWNLNGLKKSMKQHYDRLQELMQGLGIKFFCFQEIYDEKFISQLADTLNNQKKKSWLLQFNQSGRGKFNKKEYLATFYQMDTQTQEQNMQNAQVNNENNNQEKQNVAEEIKIDNIDMVISKLFTRKPLINKFNYEFLINQKKKFISFTITNIHLKDGSTKEGLSRLQDELNQLRYVLLELISQYQDCGFHIIIGDFNFELKQDKIESYFPNLFKKIQIQTSDKQTMVKSKKRNHYDHILVYTNDDQLCLNIESIDIPENYTRLANRQYISDHYPIAFKFKIGQNKLTNKNETTKQSQKKPHNKQC